MNCPTPSSRAKAAALALAFTGAALTPAVAQEPAIAVGALPQLDAWASGAIGPDRGGLPPNLWMGSDPTSLAAAFDALPSSFGSPAGAALALKALQSQSRAPEGAGPDLARKRFAALGKLGAADALSAMVTGQAAQDAAIIAFGAQADLGRGQDAAACARLNALMRADTIVPFALRLRAYCAARDGDVGGADLALDLARQAEATDPFLTGAVAAMLGQSRTKPAGRFDSSFNVALSLAAKATVPAGALNSSSSLALVRIARDPAAPASLRYGAAVMGLRYGIVDAATARAAIRASLAAAPAPTTKGAKPKAQVIQPLALALQTVEKAAEGDPRARAIVAALRRADTPGAYLATARLFASDMAVIAPSQALSDIAPAFAKAALARGDVAAALAWRPYLPATATAAFDTAFAAAGVADPIAAMDTRIAVGPAPLAARDVAILAALGAAPSSTATAFAQTNAPPPVAPADPAKVAALNAAADRGALGETALRAAGLLGDGAQRLDPATLARVIQVLRAAGLEGDARAAALEAMVPSLPG